MGMKASALFSGLVILTLGGTITSAVQVPLVAKQDPQSPPGPAKAPILLGSGGKNSERWNFDLEPSPNATGNYIFESVASLLQQWPNTRYRNGHNIVPATVPAGTLLYHGTTREEIPSVPEWVATDPEHSYLFCRQMQPDQGCWHLTLAVTRPLNIIYFDGSSAAKVEGTMDVQDIIAYGQTEGPFDERRRIKGLCEWGEKYGIDGFMRMEMDFEIMLCDFSRGVEIASFLNLETPIPGDLPRPPPQPHEKNNHNSTTARPDIDLSFVMRRVLESGHWHNRYPGETRTRLDLTRLVSFYDTAMFPSLVEARAGQERWDHRVEKLGEDDKTVLLGRLEEALTGPHEAGSGVDWSSLIRVIIHRYADRLEAVQYLLNSTRSASGLEEDTSETTINQMHEYVAGMLSPYILNGARPNATTSNSGAPFHWAAPIFEKCATTHTKIISTSLRSRLTPSEQLILSAIESVLHETCRVVVGIWADGVELGLDSETDSSRPGRDVAEEWGPKVDALIRWLDWSVWVKCKPECLFEETCYLPTWPWLSRRWGGPRRSPPIESISTDTSTLTVDLGGAHPSVPWLKRDRVWGWVRDLGMGYIDGDDDDDTRRPQPRCIRRLAPLDNI